MSNNKQSIKIYTEEQVRDAINVARFYTEQFMPNDTIVDMLKPIELPSDEEIENEARLYCNIKESLVIDAEERYYKDFQKYDGFKACAQWMRNKIQGTNK